MKPKPTTKENFRIKGVDNTNIEYLGSIIPSDLLANETQDSNIGKICLKSLQLMKSARVGKESIAMEIIPWDY